MLIEEKPKMLLGKFLQRYSKIQKIDMIKAQENIAVLKKYYKGDSEMRDYLLELIAMENQWYSALEKGKIDFNILLATPQMMTKLAKYAKILGPKGLMPNPKSGTITDNPQDLAEKMAGKVQFRAEAQQPLIHQIIGKVDDSQKNLEENFQTLIQAVGPKNIQKAVITSTMGPGIKVSVEKQK